MHHKNYILVALADEERRSSVTKSLETEFGDSNTKIESYPDLPSMLAFVQSPDDYRKHSVSVVILDDNSQGLRTAQVSNSLNAIDTVKDATENAPMIMISNVDFGVEETIKILQSGVSEVYFELIHRGLLLQRVRDLISQGDAGEFTVTDKNNVLEIDDIGGALRRASENAVIMEKIGAVTLELVSLSEAIKGENALLGDVLRRQLTSTLKTIIAELESEFIDVETVRSKTRNLARVGERVSSEALSKGLGNMFKRSSDLLFDLLANLL